MNVFRLNDRRFSKLIQFCFRVFFGLSILSLCIFVYIIHRNHVIAQDVQRLRKQYLMEPIREETVGYEIDSNDRINYTFEGKKPSIAIVTVVRRASDVKNYDIAISTVQCYAKIHKYHYIIAEEKDFPTCQQKDRFFRRHCIVARILPKFEVVLFLDSDMGVVNPKRKIEEFLDKKFDITFYDRFYNWEIMAGSYLVRNTQYSIDFLEDFANYEKKLPNSFHGTDNGAIHFFFAEKFFPQKSEEIDLCRAVYNYSTSFKHVFIYEACLRAIFGSKMEFDRVRVLPKGKGWARDSWITNSVWNQEIGDFILHSWKTHQIRRLHYRDIKPSRGSMFEWINPLAGPIHINLCHPRNMTWTYDPILVGNKYELEEHLEQFKKDISRDKIMYYSKIKSFL